MKEQIKDAMDQLLAIAGGEATFSEVNIKATSARGTKFSLDVGYSETNKGVSFKVDFSYPYPIPALLRDKLEKAEFVTADQAYRTAIDYVDRCEQVCETL